MTPLFELTTIGIKELIGAPAIKYYTLWFEELLDEVGMGVKEVSGGEV